MVTLPDQRGPLPARRLARRAFWSLVTLVGLVACGTLVEPHEWKPERGPVVPHDSFPGDCRLCHEGNGWNQIKADFSFDHEKETGVALLGAHRLAECLRCHNDRGPVETFAARGCRGCHVDPHRGKLGQTCDACHQETDWNPRAAIAEHASTRFPLVGAHAVTACWRCHPGAQVGNFEGQSPDCVSCHLQDLSRTANPDHRVQGWTDDCQRCHLPLSWIPARFDHPGNFPLTQGHGGLSCTVCHGNDPTFGGLSPQCDACHLDEYQATNDPSHAAANFDRDCRICHSTASWLGARYDHPGSFLLSGGHAGRRCSACHQGNVFDNTPTDCQSCHLDDYNRTTDPNHATSGFDLDCTLCHNTNTWSGARFDHPQSFPLTLGHAGRRCSDCHQNGTYQGTPTDCQACHLDDFNGTTDPNHVTSGFDRDCTICHDTSTWDNGRFNHPQSFPLQGGHAGRSCSDCHQNGNYSNTPTDCVACHLDDFNGTTNPNHRNQGFGTDCQVCHRGVDTWRGAVFNHSFPRTGDHNVSCTDCHTTPGNSTAFSCIHCHDHSQSRMADKHREVNGYVWASPDCLRCHPNGRE